MTKYLSSSSSALTCLFFLLLLQADYLQPKLLGILAFFNMQLLSSSAGEKDRKKLVSVKRTREKMWNWITHYKKKTGASEEYTLILFSLTPRILFSSSFLSKTPKETFQVIFFFFCSWNRSRLHAIYNFSNWMLQNVTAKWVKNYAGMVEYM